MPQRNEPDADPRWVLALYGSTMLAVQGVENAVSWLYLLANTERTGRHGSAKRILTKAFVRSWSAFQRGTGAMRLNDQKRGLRSILEPNLYRELDAFLKGPRAELAHRFLLERTRLVAREVQFRPGTVGELLDLTIQANSLMRRLHEHAEQLRATWEDAPDAPEELREHIEMIARAAMLKEFPPEFLDRASQ